MTKSKYILLALTAFVLAACNEDPTYYTLDDQPDDMHLQVSDTVLTLNKAKEDQTAVTFKWDAVKSPIEKYDSITYAIRLYNTDDKTNSTTEFINVGKDRTYSFTTDELNTIVGKWVTAGTTVNMTAEVVGTVNNNTKYIKPEKSTTTLKVTGYEKYPTYLYMHITTDEGKEQTVRLSQRNLGTGIYEATTEMEPCSYYFTTTATSQYPAYGQDKDSLLAYVTEGTIPQFKFEDIGTRTIIVDTNNDYFDCHVYNMLTLPNGYMHIVGDGCSIGWSLDNSAANFVQEDPRHPYLWSWTGQFNAQKEIKIALGTGWGDQFFYAPEANADPLTNHTLLPYRYQSAGGDVKWVPSVSGKYKFTLCILADDLWTSFVPAK